MHSFGATSGDGSGPLGSLTLVGPVLYGVTTQGGGGAGSIFRINTDATAYTKMHTFGGPGDGANPVGELLPVGSELFGTTPHVAPNSLGVLFGINMDGTSYNVIYSFKGAPNDGDGPTDLTELNGVLYGMTAGGGSANDGTIFSISIPEPSSLLLLAAAGAGSAAVRWFRQRRKARPQTFP